MPGGKEMLKNQGFKQKTTSLLTFYAVEVNYLILYFKLYLKTKKSIHN